MIHRAQKYYLRSCTYIFLHCVVDHQEQKAYRSNLSTFRQFACNIIVHKSSICSDDTFAHHLFACTKVLFQTSKYKKGFIAQQCCNTGLWHAQMFYLKLLKTQKFYL